MQKRNIRLERLRYAADISKFLRSELCYLTTQRVLDAGCGTGLISRALKKQYPNTKITGIDNDRKSVVSAHARAKHSHLKIDYAVGDLENIPFASKSFDTVLAAIVLHHIRAESRERVLGEFYRVLSNNGILVILEGRGLARSLVRMMQGAGFVDVQKKTFTDIRRIYTGKKQQIT